MSIVTDLTDMITPVLEKAGFRLWDVSVTKAGKRSLVTVTLDKTGGANIDEIAEMSKSIAPLLDEYPSLSDAYHLEVATPGLERALTKPEHFRYSLGSEIIVSYRSDALVRTKAKLISVSDADITIESDQGETTTISFESITKAHTVFDFDQAMKKPMADDQSRELEGEIA